MIKILFLTSNPLNTNPLRLDEEMRAIDAVIHQAELCGQIVFHSHWAVRISDLQEFLLRHQPHIVHFSGHGSAIGEIILQDLLGNAQPVPADALNNLFRLLKDQIRCVVLNACFSASQAVGIAQQIDCVIGISEAISDRAAIEFVTAFYRALGYGRDVATAFELGCNQIKLGGFNEADKPKLLGKVDAAQVRLVNPATLSALTSPPSSIPQVNISGGVVQGLIQENKGNITFHFDHP